MSEVLPEIDAGLAEWIRAQHVFFVATAPMAAEGLINCSPKGMDTFRILGPRTVGYLDLTGSGVETIAHLKENGRIVIMFCGFAGEPRILRLHGAGRVIVDEACEHRQSFPNLPGARSIILVEVQRIAATCGFGVPEFEYVGERDQLLAWAKRKGEAGLAAYRHQKNQTSLDGLAGLAEA